MNKENIQTQNPKIEILPEHIIDQIKAGEVLERPASLAKELLENSLDANASEINIHLIENGLDLLSIEDNGHGMTFENLPYAFLRHATSKLKNYDDLFHLKSFGFRGEALASVAASSRLTCTTQPKNPKLPGGKIIIHGGAEELLIPYRSNSHGTSIYIKDLFYNTPARLKFIKSKTSEKSALKKMLYAFVLSNPKVNFSIKWDEKEKEIFKSVNEDDTIKRIQQVFFSKTSKENKDIKTQQLLVWQACEEYENYKVEIFFTPETYSTPQYRHHYLFANNRFFQDKSIHQALLRTLEPLWHYGESGHYVVKITTPTEEIDVNVHPNKTQIKFLKSDVIYSLLVSGLRATLKRNSTPTIINLENSPVTQDNFFTREENQTLDLMNMGRNDHQSSILSSIASPEFTSFSSTSILGFISENIIILKREDKFYITDLKKVMARYLALSLINFKEKEETAGPLLISEPLKVAKGKIDRHFEDLKNLGFEIDRLNNEVLALRTLPRFIPQSLIRTTTECILKYFESPKTNNFEASEFIAFAQENWSSSASLSFHTLLPILESEFIKSSNLLVVLNEETVKGLLK